MKKIIFLVVIIASMSTSCKKLVEDMNIDPNNPQDATAITMLTGTELADVLVHEGELARRSGMWSGYFTGQLFQYQNYHLYNVIANDYSDSWSFVFAATIKNARLMRQKALQLNNKRLAGVAQVLEAHAAGTATALWGDIPFSQVYDVQYPNPAFDPQVQVYADLQTLLDSAIVNLASPAFVSFAAQDIFYAGDAQKWAQAAYTLKARYFMHTKQYASALSAAQFGVSAQANSMMAPHIDNASASNLFYQFNNDERAGYMNTANAFAGTIINPAGGKYRGNSKTNETARYKYLYRSATDINYNNVGGAFNKTTAYPLVSYAENLLILAEADARVNGFAAGLTRLNAYRTFLNTGGYLSSTYAVAGTFKYDAYTSADFNIGGVENSSNAYAVWPLTANASGAAIGNGATDITMATATTVGYSTPVYRSTGLKLTGNANGDSTTLRPNWAAEGTATTINSSFSGITYHDTTRYAQFDLTLAPGSSFILSNIAVPVTVSGSGTLYVGVAYSLDNWATFTYLTAAGNVGEPATSAAAVSAGLASPITLTSAKVSVSVIVYRRAASVGNYASANIGSVTIALMPASVAAPLAQDRALLKEILEERYVTFFGQIEGFNDVRRTSGEADICVPVLPNKGAQLPQRFLYPQSEIDRNPATPTPIPSIFVTTPVNQ